MYFPELEIIVTTYGINREIIEKLDNWLGTLQPNRRGFISPAYFSQDTGYPLELSMDLFNHAMNIGLFDLNIEVYCPKCKEFVEVFYPTLIPDKIICRDCKHEFYPNEHLERILLTYKLLKKPSVDSVADFKKKIIQAAAV